MNENKLFFAIFLILFSCNINPDWEAFRSNNILDKKSEVKAYSGLQTYHWYFSNNEKVTKNEVIKFAESEGWTFIKTEKFQENTFRNWNGTFPLGPFGLQINEEFSFHSLDKFPIRMDLEDFTLFHFKTSNSLIDFRDGTTTNHNGFVILNQSRTEMQMFYLWGE